MNKSLPFVLVLVLVLLHPVVQKGPFTAAQSQSGQDDLYDFKGDRLGMSLKEFQAAHRNPGHSELQTGSCDKKGACKTVEVWKPDMNCKEVTKVITVCWYQTTVVNVGTNVNALFADGELAAVRVLFNFGYLAAVQDAMVTKLGTPTSSIAGQRQTDGFMVRWENGVSVAELQAHDCENGKGAAIAAANPQGQLPGWSWDISYALQAHYCGLEDVLSYQDSRILYVHKALGSLAQKRIEEAVQEATAKARKDI